MSFCVNLWTKLPLFVWTWYYLEDKKPKVEKRETMSLALLGLAELVGLWLISAGVGGQLLRLFRFPLLAAALLNFGSRLLDFQIGRAHV